jgi:hypothetical protein
MAFYEEYDEVRDVPETPTQAMISAPWNLSAKGSRKALPLEA